MAWRPEYRAALAIGEGRPRHDDKTCGPHTWTPPREPFRRDRLPIQAVRSLFFGGKRMTVRKRGNTFVVLDRRGRVLGRHDTRSRALRHLRAIEASKRRRAK